MSISGLIPLRFQKNWFRDSYTAEQNWDELANKTQEYALRTNNNLLQMGYDLGGASYQFNNNGVKTQATSVFDRLTALESQVDFQSPGIQNIGFDFSTAGSIIITGGNGTGLSSTNKGIVTVVSQADNGELVTYEVTADVTIAMTGAHWGAGGGGDLTDQTLFLLALDTGTSLAWGISARGGRTTVASGDCFTVASSVVAIEDVLTNTTVGATNYITEIGYFRADFDDTGSPLGEDAWTIDTAYPVVYGDSLKQRLYFNRSNVLISANDLSFYSGADLNVYSDAGATLQFKVDAATGNVIATGSIGVTSGSNIYLDGVGLTGNTYIEESSADVLRLVYGGVAADFDYNGGTPFLNLTGNGGTHISLSQGKRLILDSGAPAAGAEYIHSPANDQIECIVGTSQAWISQYNSGNPFTQIHNPIVPSGEKLVLDGVVPASSAEYIQFTGGVINIFSNSDAVVQIDSGGSGADNYLSVNHPDNTAGSDSQLRIIVAGTSAGDPAITWQGAGVDWHMGADTSSSGVLRIGSGTSVATTDLIRIGTESFTVSDDGSVLSSNSNCRIASVSAQADGTLLASYSTGAGNGRIIANTGTGNAYLSLGDDNEDFYVAVGVDTSSTFMIGSSPTVGNERVITITGARIMYFDYLVTDTTASSANCVVDGVSGRVQRSTSSARYKTDIRTLENTESVFDLRPVIFKDKRKAEEGKLDDYVGLIAEEVFDHCPHLVTLNSENQPEAVNYDRLGVYLLAELKKLKTQLNELLK